MLKALDDPIVPVQCIPSSILETFMTAGGSIDFGDFCPLPAADGSVQTEPMRWIGSPGSRLQASASAPVRHTERRAKRHSHAPILAQCERLTSNDALWSGNSRSPTCAHALMKRASNRAWWSEFAPERRLVELRRNRRGVNEGATCARK
jgi:hypothetical protein